MCVLRPAEPREGDGVALCSSVRPLGGCVCAASGADRPEHEKPAWRDTAGPGSTLRTAAGGASAAQRSPQPYEPQHTPTHASAPRSPQRTSLHRAGAAGGRHGRQHRGM